MFIVSFEEMLTAVCGSGNTMKSSPGIKLLSWTGLVFIYNKNFISNYERTELFFLLCYSRKKHALHLNPSPSKGVATLSCKSDTSQTNLSVTWKFYTNSEGKLFHFLTTRVVTCYILPVHHTNNFIQKNFDVNRLNLILYNSIAPSKQQHLKGQCSIT